MIVNDNHVKLMLYHALDKGYDYFIGMLESSCEEAFVNRLLSFMVKFAPSNLPEPERRIVNDEFYRQVCFLVTVLGPIYEASNRRLPMVTAEEFDKKLKELPALIDRYERYIESFKAYHYFWYRLIKAYFDSMTKIVSKIIMAAVAEIFTERLASPLEPVEYQPEDNARVLEQVKAILAGGSEK